MTPREQNDFVAEKLGLWTNPWMLVEALWQRGYDVEFTQSPTVQIWSREYDEGEEEEQRTNLISHSLIINGDLALALLEATYKMLKKEK